MCYPPRAQCFRIFRSILLTTILLLFPSNAAWIPKVRNGTLPQVQSYLLLPDALSLLAPCLHPAPPTNRVLSLFAFAVSFNTVRRDPADSIPSSGRKSSLRKSMLAMVLNQKSEAATSPTQLQKKYYEQNVNPSKKHKTEGKFVKWDDFPGVWRCDPPSEDIVNCSLDFAMKVANSMSMSELNQEELGEL